MRNYKHVEIRGFVKVFYFLQEKKIKDTVSPNIRHAEASFNLFMKKRLELPYILLVGLGLNSTL
jgi:hypothetical protein